MSKYIETYQTELKSCVIYQDTKVSAQRKLDHFMIKCWAAVHEKIKEHVLK